MTYIPLSNLDVAAVSVFVLLSGLLSLWLSLGIERQLLVGAVRMVVQLTAVGAVLTFLFGVHSPLWILAMAVAMVLFAGREVGARQQHRLAGAWGYGLGTATMTLAAATLTLVALLGSVQPEPWYNPRFAIPLFGMILGNAMTGIALGASRLGALRPAMREAMRRGLMPMINAMAAAGVVSLPGMMTGQILAGASPADAVRYQLLIMFLIVGTTGLGLLLAVFSAAWRLTDERHRLRLDRLRGAA